MKGRITVLVIGLIFYSGFLYSQAPPESAEVVLQSAYKEAAKKNKNVIVLFHASLCVWCRKMDTSMNDPKVQKYFTDNYVIKHLVVHESKDKKVLENPGAEDLLKKYHGNDSGIPYWLVFDKSGKLLADSKVRAEGEGLDKGQNSGCPATEQEVEHFINVLKKTSSLKPEELAVIAKRFRKNDN